MFKCEDCDFTSNAKTPTGRIEALKKHLKDQPTHKRLVRVPESDKPKPPPHRPRVRIGVPALAPGMVLVYDTMAGESAIVSIDDGKIEGFRKLVLKDGRTVHKARNSIVFIRQYREDVSAPTAGV